MDGSDKNKQLCKSQLAKDLENALCICRLVDDLSELVDTAEIRDKEHTSKQVRDLITTSYLRAVALLACSIVDSKGIRNAMGL